MTTLGQLDKAAGKFFNNRMRRRGFAVERKFVFWRKRGPLYDMLMPQIISGGEHLRITISIWSPWVDDIQGEFIDFPPDMAMIGGDLSEYFPKRMHSGELFPIVNEEEMESSFLRVVSLVDNFAIPWFSTVTSYESYVSHIGNGYNPTRERQAQVKVGIGRGFELEPYF